VLGQSELQWRQVPLQIKTEAVDGKGSSEAGPIFLENQNSANRKEFIPLLAKN
jgi:hypothetical protein